MIINIMQSKIIIAYSRYRQIPHQHLYNRPDRCSISFDSYKIDSSLQCKEDTGTDKQ